ncbi:hypothetical protein ACFQ4O_00515 [Methylopila musalis]|uniref:Uncharacterized protein n=1 Tax=Methylopila musalis TaxID=1134781 RepID=A0ABW3Z3I5_9HYPH
MGNILKLVAVVVIAALGYWSWYASYGSNPEERVGAALTRWMPGPVKDWGCGHLTQRFGPRAPTECAPSAVRDGVPL